MKKLLVLLTVLCMIWAMAACDPLPNAVTGEEEEPPVPEAEMILPENGYAEGFLGDGMRTAFFDFVVNDAYLTGEYEGYTPSEGYTLLVTNVTVYNYTDYSVTMFDTDFQTQWNDASDDAFAVPVTYERDGYPNTGVKAAGDMLEGEYTVGIRQSARGDLVFQVPEGQVDFSISYQEYYDREEDPYGDLFFVYFTPEMR